MKKTLSLLTLAALAFGSQAHAEDLIVTNQTHGLAIHAFTTEKIDGEEVLKDSVCILPNNMAYLQNFSYGTKYKLIIEYQLGNSCTGPTRSIESEFAMLSDLQADVNNSYMVIKTIR